MNARKPIPGVNHPDDEKAIKDAEAMIGDFKLKSAIDYKPPADRKDTTLSKYSQLLNTREDVNISNIATQNRNCYLKLIFRRLNVGQTVNSMFDLEFFKQLIFLQFY